MALWLKCWASHGLSKFFSEHWTPKARENAGSYSAPLNFWAYQDASAVSLQFIGFCFEVMMVAVSFLLESSTANGCCVAVVAVKTDELLVEYGIINRKFY